MQCRDSQSNLEWRISLHFRYAEASGWRKAPEPAKAANALSMTTARLTAGQVSLVLGAGKDFFVVKMEEEETLSGSKVKAQLRSEACFALVPLIGQGL
jgi:hypothetical protein